jgi:hypothetical protein
MNEWSDERRDPTTAGNPADLNGRADANPPDNRDDCFGPPEKPVECFCLHCGHIYMSDLLLAVNVDGTTHYACPVKGCDAMGYKFDIFPVNDEDDEDGGWIECDEDEFDEEEEAEEFEDEFTDSFDPDGEIPFDPPQDWSPEEDAEAGEAYEDDEPQYFTREEYEALKATGEYDRRAEEIRQWWRQCEADRKTGDNGTMKDDDIPF